jgi:hypothetical protein
MVEQILQNILPSSEQLVKTVWYTAGVLLCTYTIMGMFFVALYKKRSKNDLAQFVEMHNDSAQKCAEGSLQQTRKRKS